MVRASVPDVVLGKVRYVDSLAPLLPIIGILAIFWLLILRPAQHRQKQLRNVQGSLGIGDRVITNSGIFGTITRIEDDRVGLEVADGVVITVALPAIVGVTPDDDVDVDAGEIQTEGQE